MTPLNNWVLFIGGPNSGKTTLANYLKHSGYRVKDEQARALLDEYIARGIRFDEIMNNSIHSASFQEEIAKKEIAVEATLDPREITFFDRSCVEYTAFVKLRGFKVNADLQRKLSHKSYRLALVLDYIPTDFAQNKLESGLDDPKAASKKQEAALIEVIKEIGTPIAYVPVLPIEERVRYVENLCRQHGLDVAGAQ